MGYETGSKIKGGCGCGCERGSKYFRLVAVFLVALILLAAAWNIAGKSERAKPAAADDHPAQRSAGGHRDH